MGMHNITLSALYIPARSLCSAQHPRKKPLSNWAKGINHPEVAQMGNQKKENMASAPCLASKEGSDAGNHDETGAAWVPSPPAVVISRRPLAGDVVPVNRMGWRTTTANRRRRSPCEPRNERVHADGASKFQMAGRPLGLAEPPESVRASFPCIVCPPEKIHPPRRSGHRFEYLGQTPFEPWVVGIALLNLAPLQDTGKPVAPSHDTINAPVKCLLGGGQCAVLDPAEGLCDAVYTSLKAAANRKHGRIIKLVICCCVWHCCSSQFRLAVAGMCCVEHGGGAERCFTSFGAAWPTPADNKSASVVRLGDHSLSVQGGATHPQFGQSLLLRRRPRCPLVFPWPRPRHSSGLRSALRPRNTPATFHALRRPGAGFVTHVFPARRGEEWGRGSRQCRCKPGGRAARETAGTPHTCGWPHMQPRVTP